MKKIFILAISILMLFSCKPNYNENNMAEPFRGEYAMLRNEKGKVLNSMMPIYEITVRGETHEYIWFHATYEGSLSHWAGCKYCKEKNQTENN